MVMVVRLIKRKYREFVILILLFLILYFYNIPIKTRLNSKSNFDPSGKIPVVKYETFEKSESINIKSNCPLCRPDIKIDKRQFEQLSTNDYYCNIYSLLTRKSNQKVIGLSLYGNNKMYYERAGEFIKQANKAYPDWNIRIYFDKTTRQDIICDLECSEFGKTIDFCNSSEIVRFFNNSKGHPEMYHFDLSYMHAMSWRFLPIGDDHVDVFMSRDTDEWVIQREIDSVNVWMSSNTLFHVMRDHPEHSVAMLGGLWGYKNRNDRAQSKKILNIITNYEVASSYNSDKQNGKGNDQDLLEDYVWPFAKLNITNHDSYFCERYNGQPFPTQRIRDSCYISCFDCCFGEFIKKKSGRSMTCPVACRPKTNKNWIYC